MKILIAGTGWYQEEFERFVRCGIEIVGYVQTVVGEQDTKNGKKIYSYEQINEVDYDKIVVANIYSNEIKKTMKKFSINLNDVVFLVPWNYLDYDEGKMLFHWDLLEDIAPEYMSKANFGKNRCKYVIADRMYKEDIEESILESHEVQRRDYFRYRTFELVANQLKHISGCAAEVGVFQGEFSEIINTLMPERTLYLFDTFESFEESEYQREKALGNTGPEHLYMFKNTSVERVLKRMPYPKQCIIKKGFFPKTAENIDETFAFVSIDVDLEESIYNSLQWFLPRMEVGGIIFLHDYNNRDLFGVRKAVERYEKSFGKLYKVPIADKFGTLVIFCGK